MQSALRRGFRGFTVLLCVVTAWTVYANVVSENEPVKRQAEERARAFAGCGASCKIVGMHGDRGMLATEIIYTIDRVGQVVVTCRRAYVAFGDHACVAAKP